MLRNTFCHIPGISTNGEQKLWSAGLRCWDDAEGDQTDEANVHLLAALGKFDTPFVPVDIHHDYDGYSWANLPTVGQVKAVAGKKLQEAWVGGALLACVDSLSIIVHASDGKVFRSDVCMAVKPLGPRDKFDDCRVYVTAEAQTQLTAQEIWHQLGGYGDDGDSYDTQEYRLGQELDGFWQRLLGEYQPLRAELMDCMSQAGVKKWKRATLRSDGQLVIHWANGKQKTIAAPDDGNGKEVRA